MMLSSASSRSLLHRMLVVVACVALFATACGTESAAPASTDAALDVADEGSDANDATGQPADDQQDDAADETVDASGSAGESKTLAEYVGNARGGRGGQGPGGGGDIDDRLAEQAQVEVEIQRCMQAQGFTYVPEEVTGGLGAFLAQSNQGLSPVEFAETKGFGISTRFDEILDGDMVLEADEADANEEHLATLSEGEADAWQFALRGAPPERNEQGQPIDPETGEVLQGAGRRGGIGGCNAEANTTVRGDRSVINSLSDEFDALEARIQADPRVAEIARDWSSCMRDAGFGYENQDEARSEIQQEFRPLIREAFGRGRPDFSQLSLTDDQEESLRQLQDREIALATASLSCQGDTSDEVAEITARYEAEFVEANREVLETIGN